VPQKTEVFDARLTPSYTSEDDAQDVALAIENYARFHGIDLNDDLERHVRNSSAGIKGWMAACVHDSIYDNAARAIVDEMRAQGARNWVVHAGQALDLDDPADTSHLEGAVLARLVEEALAAPATTQEGDELLIAAVAPVLAESPDRWRSSEALLEHLQRWGGERVWAKGREDWLVACIASEDPQVREEVLLWIESMQDPCRQRKTMKQEMPQGQLTISSECSAPLTSPLPERENGLKVEQQQEEYEEYSEPVHFGPPEDCFETSVASACQQDLPDNFSSRPSEEDGDDLRLGRNDPASEGRAHDAASSILSAELFQEEALSEDGSWVAVEPPSPLFSERSWELHEIGERGECA